MHGMCTNLEETLRFKDEGTESLASVTSLTEKFSTPSVLLSHSSPHSCGSVGAMFAFYLSEFHQRLTVRTTRAGTASAALRFVHRAYCAPRKVGTPCVDLRKHDSKEG